MKEWLFWDYWHIERQENAALCQGKPQWVPEATYEDPVFNYLGFWPKIWKDTESGLWRMLYIGSGIPMNLMIAESDDGIHWQPGEYPDIDPGGEKHAPNHLLSIPAANGGPVYLDAQSNDGFPFKLPLVQRGGKQAPSAKHDNNTDIFHELVSGKDAKNHQAMNRMAVSADGIHWSFENDITFNIPGWHPDPPFCCFYNSHANEHVMVTRPGWGDRRIATLSSPDCKNWSNLELALQPDLIDDPQVQFYGMPVHPYGEGYVGFLWVAHFSNAERLGRFNQLHGYIDNQLTYSRDGQRFQRQLREPFIELNEPDEPGAGIIYPTCMIENGDELRIYSAATRDLHFQHTTKQFTPKNAMPDSSVIMHRLRKDGFMFLASKGNWATVLSKPLTLFQPKLTANVQAPHGEFVCRITDLKSNVLEGFSFDTFICEHNVDQTDFKLQWQDQNLDSLTGKAIRLEIKFRNSRFYAIRGNFHFIDALDMTLLNEGKELGPLLFDY
jgi:hypothetical protein